jgi:hypothetical protein
MNTTHQQHDRTGCLACDKDLSKKPGKRGLCIACYEQFRRARDAMPAEKRPAFEDRLIALGKLSPDARKPNNIFDEVRLEIESQGDEPNHITPVGRKKSAPKKTSTTTKRKASG